jgi:VWFA-related protein
MSAQPHLILLALVAACLRVSVSDGSAGQDPVFRSKATIVPVAVRVIGRNGEPVIGLTQADFEVTEDGKPQAISYFTVEDYARAEDYKGEDDPLTSFVSLPVSRSDERVFVIVLGRGRLQGPSKGFDALRNFVKGASFERDRFAVAAFDRITDVTGDRSAIVRFLDHYQSNHHTIEALLDHWFRDLTDFYGTGENPPRLDRLIDRFFEQPGMPPSSQLALVSSMSRETRPDANLAQPGESPRRFIYNAAARQDLERLRAAIEHLRVMEGEKHIIFVTPEGLIGLTRFHADRLASLASHARVSLSMIHTGGLSTRWVNSGRSRVFQGPSWDHRWATENSRIIAEHTGGLSSIYEFAAPMLTQLEKASRLHYLIGYVPTRIESKGAYRRIKVTVRRSDVTLHYRRGYLDAPHTSVSLQEERVNSRINGAQMYRLPIEDIKVRVSAIGEPEGNPRAIAVQIHVLPSELSFAVQNGRYMATVEIAVFVGEGGRQIGQTRRRVELRLTPSSFAAVERDGLHFTTNVPVPSGRPRQVKVVVYDHAADRLGSALFGAR